MTFEHFVINSITLGEDVTPGVPRAPMLHSLSVAIPMANTKKHRMIRMTTPTNQILEGDCATVLSSFPDNSVDLIVTSPPYANARRKTYGGPLPDEYVEWFLPRAKQFRRVLKPTGTFILNIKEKVVNGARHTYVLDLIRAIIAQGWVWTDEFIWHKPNAFVGLWRNRFRDAWERCLQFNKSKVFKMNQEAVKRPVGNWRDKRRKTLCENDLKRTKSKTGSGFAKKMANLVEHDMVLPSNVLFLATVCHDKGHSAAFPKALPEFFVKLFSDPGDLVLDPFVGSGTTCVVAKGLGRRFIGIDSDANSCELARAAIEKK